MEVEIKVDEKYTESKIIIYTNKLDEEVNNIIDGIFSINTKKLKAYKDDRIYILNPKEDIEAIYSEKGKVLARCNKEIYTLKNRLYELETILDKKIFTRISNSEIVNFNKVENIKNYIENVTNVTQTVRSVNDLNVAIKDFEFYTLEVGQENRSLQYQIEQKDEVIEKLNDKLSAKDKIIIKLQEEKESLKAQLQKFKGFWHNLMSHFHKRITYDNDKNYKIVSDDLYKNGIFDDNYNEIANNILRKVTISNEKKAEKNKKRNNDTRF